MLDEERETYRKEIHLLRELLRLRPLNVPSGAMAWDRRCQAALAVDLCSIDETARRADEVVELAGQLRESARELATTMDRAGAAKHQLEIGGRLFLAYDQLLAARARRHA